MSRNQIRAWAELRLLARYPGSTVAVTRRGREERWGRTPLSTDEVILLAMLVGTESRGTPVGLLAYGKF